MGQTLLSRALPAEQRDELRGFCLSPSGVPRVDEGGWNTVQGAKNSRVLDPTKFLKITKVGASTRLFQGNKTSVSPGRTGTVCTGHNLGLGRFKSSELVLCVNKAPLSSGCSCFILRERSVQTFFLRFTVSF